MIAPWEVEQLNDEWLKAATEITQGQQKLRERQAAERVINSKLAAWRASHPAYRRAH